MAVLLWLGVPKWKTTTPKVRIKARVRSYTEISSYFPDLNNRAPNKREINLDDLIRIFIK